VKGNRRDVRTWGSRAPDGSIRFSYAARMRTRVAPQIFIGVSLLTFALGAFAQEAGVVVESVKASPSVVAVTLYQGRAMVSRVAEVPGAEGTFEIRFEGLPAALESSSLQATVAAPLGGAKLLDVRYDEKVTLTNVTNNPELAAAIKSLNEAQRIAERLGLEMTAISDRYAFLAAIRTKTATETAKELGTQALVPEALAKQMAFIDGEQSKLIADRVALDAQTRATTDAINTLQATVNALGGQSKVERTAIVSVGKSSSASSTVTLRYLVRDAGWSPRYAVRADVDAGALVVEYDAEIRQATGEDWKDVDLVLSTAQPTQRAAPADVSAFYVDVYVPPPASPAMAYGVGEIDRSAGMAGEKGANLERAWREDARKSGKPGIPGAGGRASDPMSFGDAPAENLAFKALYEDVAASRSGTVVSFPIPRATTIASDATRTRKLRIATVETKPAFVHVARPLIESAVYLKAVAANASSYQFLAGPATVFLGGDSVGSTSLPDLAVGAEMTFWLGTDRRIEAKRVIVKKDSGEKGVFGKSDVTQWDYRIDLTSTDTKPVTVEVMDRMPVSRNEQIKIELKNDIKQGGAALASDAKYVADEQPQGILKWIVQIPAAKIAGTPATKSIAWSVIVSKPKDVETTGLPD